MKKRKKFKKKLVNFVKDESGEISREKVLQIGLGTVSALGIMAAFSPDSSVAAHTSSHNPPPGAPNLDGNSCVISHQSHSSHSSY